MKILITGKNSYIGNSVKSWLNLKEPSYLVDDISLRNKDLKTISFKNYDVIFHIAGIAHITSKKKMVDGYFRINRDLAIEVAKKAKEEGVKHFIFTSSMAIYGDDRSIGDFRPIEVDKPSPNNAYSQSKLEADLYIQKLQDGSFDVSVIRMPLVYGKFSKGNFLKLVNLSKRITIFPAVKNIRSILHINNLSELVRLIILNRLKGLFFPQDEKYFSTNNFIFKMRSSIGKKTIFIPFLSFPLSLLGLFIKPIQKIYGNKYYEITQSSILNLNYQLFSVEDFIKELNNI